MEINFKREANDSYLIIEENNSIMIDDNPEEEEDAYYTDFHFRMITENSIPGLLSVSRQNFNGKNQFYYRISGKQSLKEAYEKKEMGRDDFMHLLLHLRDLLNTLNQYLLDSDYLLLSPEFIYVSATSGEVEFCMYPMNKKDIKKQIRSLCEYFLNHIDHEDEKVVSLAYQLYRLTREEKFEFHGIVSELAICVEDTECLNYEKNTDTVENTDNVEDAKIVEKKYHVTEEKKNIALEDKPQLCENDNLSAEEKIPAFKILAGCLTGGSFLSFLYIYFVKSYFYGYSPGQIITAKETIIGFVLFVLSGGITLLYSFFSSFGSSEEGFPGKKMWKFKK